MADNRKEQFTDAVREYLTDMRRRMDADKDLGKAQREMEDATKERDKSALKLADFVGRNLTHRSAVVDGLTVVIEYVPDAEVIATKRPPIIRVFGSDGEPVR